MASKQNAHDDTTVRNALRKIRADLEGVNYLSGPRLYECDQGTIYVRNASASDGGGLLGVFEAELVSPSGETVRRYTV